MRELWARRLAAVTGLLVLLLSAAFAAVQNPPVATAAALGTSVAAEAVDARGRAVFDANDCARCHSIAGEGSPRSALDGVASRLWSEEIRHFVNADEAVQEELAPRAIAAKRPYAELPAAELDALVAYLASLK